VLVLEPRRADKGDAVLQGQNIARSGTGHVGDSTPNVHLGVRLAGEYVDPMTIPVRRASST
jgi:septal ring factor EnvC (AmiA/AmiB activator)